METSNSTQEAQHPRAARTDGEQTRERLLKAGLRLFAEKGYAQTSTREIAAAAQANIGAIAYYFEGKAGLYKTLYNTPISQELGQLPALAATLPPSDEQLHLNPQAWLRAHLKVFYGGFTESHKCGEWVRLCTRLHMREMIDPTGVVGHTDDCSILLHHQQIQALLCRYFGLDKPDAHLQRLEHALVGMGMYLYVGRDMTDQLCPELMASHDALDTWRDQLVEQGMALVAVDKHRRASLTRQTE
jgi:TetR/AcrR family transcriptional regulator, regulator of cefoperazone and chloramphenicol sensitivity